MVYRRKPIRRVRRGRVVKRVHRPIGSSTMGKRFAKLRYYTQLSFPSGTLTGIEYLYDDNPANPVVAEFNSFREIFDMYRVCAIEIKYIPDV